jgi:adenylosuccinate lyase
MSTNPQEYVNPLLSRYASREMARLFSDQRRFGTWRRLLVVLAETQQELGLDISHGQLAELRSKVDDIDFAAATAHERRLRHDVMAHVYAYGDACPTARKIIHLGATSCYVTDNADLLLMREGLQRLRDRLLAVIERLAVFAAAQRDRACLGFTHLQPAQPTTVGKRACLWAYDLVLDVEEIEQRLLRLKARSTKGTTGTQASFLQLFDGDHGKVRELERRVAAKLGFDGSYAVTGQTYSRKIDSQILESLAGIGQSAHKAGNDLRILASRKELEEPFEEEQIGSSAMAYKRNPMRSERMCSLARYLLSLPAAAAQTAATQWLERTLDDSALRRIIIPQAFLAADAVLILYHNVASGIVVHPAVIERNLREELPFMATENILHERIRRHSLAAAEHVKQRGQSNDLLQRLQADPAFQAVDFQELLDARHFVGRAAEQVDEFLAEIVQPLLARFPDRSSDGGAVHV